MIVIAASAGLSFLIVGAMVGVRLLALARRTRSTPELLLGGGLVSLIFVTLPAVGLSIGARLGSPEFQTTLFTLGLLPAVGFIMCLYAFTAKVFRPGRTWATASIWLSGAVSGIGLAGTIWARVSNWEADRVVGAQWALLIIGTFALGLTWTGIESLDHYRRLRKRLAIGLIDPVVCNRFLLWAIGNFGGAAGIAVVAISLSLGWRLVNHPIPVLGFAISGLALSASWYLAFLPPKAYLDRIRSRSEAAPSPAQ